MQDQDIYATPRLVTDLSQCYFYHTIDVPEIGTVQGDWDLRAKMREYLGNCNFRGKRVLDVGAANGILSFWMEKEGSDVVSFDLDVAHDKWDMVPFANWLEYEQGSNQRNALINNLNNAYWLCHRLQKSKAKVVYGDVYNIPKEIGPVDIAVYGCILLHLRDPFLALQSGSKLTREAVIVTEPLGQPKPGEGPCMRFLPDAKTMEPKDTWWELRPEAIVRMLGVLGFPNTKITYHSQSRVGTEHQMYTVVGKRT